MRHPGSITAAIKHSPVKSKRGFHTERNATLENTPRFGSLSRLTLDSAGLWKAVLQGGLSRKRGCSSASIRREGMSLVSDATVWITLHWPWIYSQFYLCCIGGPKWREGFVLAVLHNPIWCNSNLANEKWRYESFPLGAHCASNKTTRKQQQPKHDPQVLTALQSRKTTRFVH